MKIAALSVLLLVAGAPDLVAAAEAPADATVLRRFALVLSSNDGGASRTRLRFANSDAESVGRLLGTLGGVRDSDLLLIRDTTRTTLAQAFGELKTRVGREQRPHVRREVFVYYSGHSDEEGLLLGNERVTYRDLRRSIDGLGADVRIVILDSCASGALIRLKGGVHRAPFLSDVSTQARGHAFLTASSADEAAQESDRVGAAFFTHFLLSGMRGAADANHDRRVTLNEAYQFAYAETLQRTEASRAGAQHPNYDIQLAGTGDVVMTDLRASSARLVLTRELAGRIYVRDANERLVAELRKEPIYPVELGLEPGLYHVVLDRDGTITRGDFDLSASGRVEVTAAQLTAVAPLVSIRRGDEPAPQAQAQAPSVGPATAATSPLPRRYRHVGFDMVLAPGYRLSGDTGEPVEHGFMLGMLGHSDRVRGLQLSLAGNIAQDGVTGAQIGGAVALSYGPVRGLQLAGYNVATVGVTGAQVGWLAAVATGPVRGAQVSMVNVATSDVHGAQVGVVNIERSNIEGAQVGVVNVAKTDGKVNGGQIGVVNVTKGQGEQDGTTVGVVNVTRKQRGVQIGLVNVADEFDGVQIGLVSVARKSNGASISLIPVILDGENHLTLDWNTTSAANLGFKLGTRRVYMAASLGITRDHSVEGKRYYSSSLGFGVHAIPRGGRVFLDIGASSTGFDTFTSSDDEKRLVASLRIQIGFAIARRLAIVAGPTVNTQVAWAGQDRSPRGVRFAQQTWTTGETVVRLYPGLQAGLEF